MNERLTLQDLIDILAKKQDITKKDAETFLRELIAVISENIEKNEPVKIKDFGVFKLVKVNIRRSVDVNTGEAIEIPAHYKLSFTPDRLLKEAINRPFAHFESVILEDGVAFDSMESEEGIEESEDSDVTIDEEEADIIAPVIPKTVDLDITDGILLSDVAIEEEPDAVIENIINIQSHNEESSSDIDDEIIADEVETASDTIESIENDTDITADSLTTEIPEPDETFETDNENSEEEGSDDTQSGESEFSPEVRAILTNIKTESDQMFESHRRKTKRRRFISVAFISLLIIAAFAIGGLYIQEIMDFVTGQSGTVDDKYKTKVVFERKIPTDTVVVTQAVTPSDTVSVNTLANVERNTEIQNGDIQKTVSQTAQDKTKPLAIHVLEYGETMRLISLKHYGHKSFWPYIYEENKNVIKNPNSVPVGTKLIIPSPAKYDIDAKNKESIEKAKAAETKLVNEMGL